MVSQEKKREIQSVSVRFLALGQKPDVSEDGVSVHLFVMRLRRIVPKDGLSVHLFVMNRLLNNHLPMLLDIRHQCLRLLLRLEIVRNQLLHILLAQTCLSF